MKKILTIAILVAIGLTTVTAGFVPDGKGGRVFCNPADTIFVDGIPIGCEPKIRAGCNQSPWGDENTTKC